MKTPILTKLSAPQAKFKKNRPKKGVFRYFLKNVDQKIAFFWRALTPQNLYISAPKTPLENFYGPSPKMIIENSTKGDYLGRQAVESLRGRCPPPP